MPTLHENTSFKIKAGVVETDAGLIPEAGAIMFDKSRNDLVYADGFNWRSVGSQSQPDAVATQLVTPVTTPMTAATPIAPFTAYDAVVYQIGTDIVPSAGNAYTLTPAGIIDISNDWAIQCDTQNVLVTVTILADGVPTLGVRLINCSAASLIYQSAWINKLQFAAGDVITYQFETSKNCDLTLHLINLGLHYQ